MESRIVAVGVEVVAQTEIHEQVRRRAKGILDECAVVMRRATGKDPIELLDQGGQPALLAVEYALSSMWMEWGVRPDSTLAHGVGEYAAACVSGGWFGVARTLRSGLSRFSSKAPGLSPT